MTNCRAISSARWSVNVSMSGGLAIKRREVIAQLLNGMHRGVQDLSLRNFANGRVRHTATLRNNLPVLALGVQVAHHIVIDWLLAHGTGEYTHIWVAAIPTHGFYRDG